MTHLTNNNLRIIIKTLNTITDFLKNKNKIKNKLFESLMI